MPIQQATLPINKNAPGGPASQENFALFGPNYHPGGVVVGQGNELAVTESAVPAMSVDVDTGGAIIDGFYGPISVKATEAVETADVTNPRIDLFISQLSNPTTITANDGISYLIIKGTPAASPVAPYASLVDTPQLRQKAWKEILVGTGVTTILNANITPIPAANWDKAINADFPYLQLYKDTNQDVVGATPERVEWDVARTDGDKYAMFDAAASISDRSEIVIPKAGKWLIQWNITWTTTTATRTYDSWLEIQAEGLKIAPDFNFTGIAGVFYSTLGTSLLLDQGDIIEIWAQHAIAESIVGADVRSTVLSMFWLGDK